MNNNGRISSPILIADIKTVIGVENDNLSYLSRNTHNRINMWSRYKPVPFRDVPAFNDTIIKLNGNSSWADTPITQGPDGILGNPWYLGGYSRPLYIAPEIFASHELFTNIYDSDTKAGAAPNPNSVWKYQAPPSEDNYPCRMGDFVGYNHNARCPLSAYTNYTDLKDYLGNIQEGYVPLDGEIWAGFNNTTNWEDPAAAKEAGELTLDDILKILTDEAIPSLYLCLVIRNVTQGTTHWCSKAVNIANEEGRTFKVKVNSSSGMKYGGMGYTVKQGDVLQIGTYLSRSADQEGISNSLLGGYSLYTDPDYAPHVCRSVIVGGNQPTVKDQYRILYTIRQFTYNAEGYLDEIDPNVQAGVWVQMMEYRNDDNNIVLRVKKGIDRVLATVNIKGMQYYNRSTDTWIDTSFGSNFKCDFNLGWTQQGGEYGEGSYLYSKNMRSIVSNGEEIANGILMGDGGITTSFGYYLSANEAINQTNQHYGLAIPLIQSRNDPWTAFVLNLSVYVHQSALTDNSTFYMHQISGVDAVFSLPNGA